MIFQLDLVAKINKEDIYHVACDYSVNSHEFVEYFRQIEVWKVGQKILDNHPHSKKQVRCSENVQRVPQPEYFKIGGGGVACYTKQHIWS